MSALPCTLPATDRASGPTSYAPYLPPVPRPPHDAYTLLLDGRVGWRPLPGKPPVIPAPSIAPLGPDGALTALPLPGSGRTLDEPNGSFGGIVLPRHIAVAALDRCQRALLLFDAKARRLRRFDPCACAFVDAFCMRPDDPRLPQGPAMLAASCARLYIADRIGRRVIVLNAATGARRGEWRAPLDVPPCTPESVLPAWEPAALAIAPNRDIWVGDRMNGALLRFAPNGKVVERHDGFGAIHAIAANCRGQLLVAAEGSSSVTFYDPATRTRLDPPLRPADIADAFPSLPIHVFADGSVDLSALCNPPCATPCVFDASGEPLTSPPEDPSPQFPTGATWHSRALDSAISECVWDRIVVTADVPAHTTVAIDTLTAETELPAEDVVDSAEWTLAAALQAPPEGVQAYDAIDFALRALPGRYLWLRVRFGGNGTATPMITRIAIDFPRISWRRYLPAIFGAEPVAAEFTDRWLAVFDRAFRGIETEIDTQARFFDPLSAPAGGKHDFLGFLASWIGASMITTLPLARRREFVKYAPRTYAWRGTMRGLTATLYLFLGLEPWCEYEAAPACCVPCPVTIPARYRWRPPRLLLEHHILRRWLWLGVGRLSDGARLWGERIVNRSRLGPAGAPKRSPGCPLPAAPTPFDDCAEPCVGAVMTTRNSAVGCEETAQLGVTQLKTSQDPFRDPFHVYAHKLSIFVPASCLRAPQLARSLAQLVKADVPAHVQATLIAVEPRFRVGVQAMLGLDAVIGYRAQTPALDAMALGKATVLGGANRDGGGHSLRVGTRRVGMDTTLQ